MIWTYRVFRDSQGRYSIREVFYNRDSTIFNYGKAPVAIVGSSLEELMQLVQWFKEAFDLPVLSLEEVESQIAMQGASEPVTNSKNLSLKQVIAELANDADPVSQS